MKAVILAAGVGKRLGSAHDGPKCLLEFKQRTLLERHLSALKACGIPATDVTFVVGYESHQIENALRSAFSPVPLTIPNPLYHN